jgi:methionine-rich copper-binding protein CopC
MSLVVRLGTLGAVLLAVLGGGLGNASAHTEFAGSEPREGQTLTTPPRQVTLTFAESVQPVSAQVSVRGADGRSVTTGPATVAEAVVRQPVDISVDGSYLVAYRVIAQDGHPVTGDVTFSYARVGSSDASLPVAGGAAGTSTSLVPQQTQASGLPAEQSPGATEGVAPVLWSVLGVVATVVIAIAIAPVVALVLRRRATGD